jgi:hypothetical protein
MKVLPRSPVLELAETAFARIPAVRSTVLDVLESAALTQEEKSAVLDHLGQNLRAARPQETTDWTAVGAPLQREASTPAALPEDFTGRTPGSVANWESDETLLTSSERAHSKGLPEILQGVTPQDRYAAAMDLLRPDSPASEAERRRAVGALLTPDLAWRRHNFAWDVIDRVAAGSLKPVDISALTEDQRSRLVDQVVKLVPNPSFVLALMFDWKDLPPPTVPRVQDEAQLEALFAIRPLPQWARSVAGYEASALDKARFLTNPSPFTAEGIYHLQAMAGALDHDLGAKVLGDVGSLEKQASEGSSLPWVLALTLWDFEQKGLVDSKARSWLVSERVRALVGVLSGDGLRALVQGLVDKPETDEGWRTLADVVQGRTRLEGPEPVLEELKTVFEGLLSAKKS